MRAAHTRTQAGDPYARMNVSPQWYGWLAAELRERDVAPVVFNLEGGYSPVKCALASRYVIEGVYTCIAWYWYRLEEVAVS